MTINSYLTGIANSSILRDQSKLDIQRSVATLNTRLQEYFGDGISRTLVFGSYSRGTILPRGMDPCADVDQEIGDNAPNDPRRCNVLLMNALHLPQCDGIPQ